MKKFRFLAIAMAAMMALGFTSCKGDDDIPYTGTTLKNGEIVTIYGDNAAAYQLRFTFGIDGGNIVVIGLNDSAANGYFTNCGTGVSIVDVGKVRGLNKIDELPSDSEFTSATVPAVEKHGYVIKAWGTANFNESYPDNPTLTDPETKYARIWLEEANGDGFNLRYEFPFVPEN
ncbi:MAG: hypothetical protein K5842_02005 [Bacteroidales bacterium]|nr:hypothetical protein [Bacteroidales bacterium]